MEGDSLGFIDYVVARHSLPTEETRVSIKILGQINLPFVLTCSQGQQVMCEKLLWHHCSKAQSHFHTSCSDQRTRKGQKLV